MVCETPSQVFYLSPPLGICFITGDNDMVGFDMDTTFFTKSVHDFCNSIRKILDGMETLVFRSVSTCSSSEVTMTDMYTDILKEEKLN